jgi:thioredoxin reductase/pSer/pThr/pTyr-binding forkhead associated (FHA) protein/ferredoxin
MSESKPLDILIVGGGPAGTAAAFRAKELGLSALVVDYDDLMKRIRDYSKDKLILPGFGGGDKMKFPEGGEMVSSLHFDPIDKDDMCVKWKGLYEQYKVDARVGIELTGLTRRADGIYEAMTYDHQGRAPATFLARHVVVAIGRGVPRRFDIPGNTDGIAYRMADPKLYVGFCVCVIGGGTSAAEAVIAISNAKAAAKDKTAVYWFYRGDQMPRVSKALADVLFDAYMGNGNIRYHPRSEPTMIMTSADRVESLAILVDRRTMSDRPSETTQMEFPKEHCIACIGEDIPESLLNTLGVQMVTGGPNNKKRMRVTPFLETEQENVYLAGDILSPAYFETENFREELTALKEVKHVGNVKSSLRDGVLVAEVIGQKLLGKKKIERKQEPDLLADAKKTDGREATITVSSHPVESAGPPAASAPRDRIVSSPVAFLIRILPGGGAENEYPLNENAITTIGRKDCTLSFPNDSMLSQGHASISHHADGYSLRDDGSETGTFLRVPEAGKMGVSAGDLVRMGRQFLLFVESNGVFSFTHFGDNGDERGQHRLSEKTIVLGRAAPDITLDPKDMTLSRRHLAISIVAGKVVIKDLKSVNGTYLRVQNAIRIDHGSQFKVGQQLFALSLKKDAVIDTCSDRVSSPVFPAVRVAPPVPVMAALEKSPAPVAGPSVTFNGTGKSCLVKQGRTICEVAEENGIDFTAECHAGICGSDPIRIISGQENLAGPMSPEEKDTLEDICSLSPSNHRLACMTRIKGPVVVEVVKQKR